MTLDEMLKPDTIRLHAGEMTPQEMLTAQAMIRWAYGEGQRAERAKDECQSCRGAGGTISGGVCAECYGQGSYSAARELFSDAMPPLPEIIPEGTPLAHSLREWARQCIDAELTARNRKEQG